MRGTIHAVFGHKYRHKQSRSSFRHITLGGGGEAKSTVGIMNFNLRMSEVRNMRKVCFNQP